MLPAEDAGGEGRTGEGEGEAVRVEGGGGGEDGNGDDITDRTDAEIIGAAGERG